MGNSAPSTSPGAVFLSYASQDTDNAQALCEALRREGVEVWFDQNELRGGDAWDAKIRQQIRTCALFIPIISLTTDARPEGYFRLEWRLADQRTHMIGRKAFVVPVCFDGINEGESDVPDSFVAAQWTHFSPGDDLRPFAQRVRGLLGGGASPRAGATRPPFAAPAPAPAVPAVERDSIAVLAFANRSADQQNEIFCDGISEELLNVLAKIPGLRVAARTSAFSFKGKQLPISEIARQLGVAFVVEGSVRRAGDRVRITAQLISAADGFHVWSDNFDRELSDIFAVQDEIASLIAGKLKLSLGRAARTSKPVNPEAHQLALEGRHYWNLRTHEGFTRAEAAFGHAIRLDPELAVAHSGLADVFAVRAMYRLADGAREAHGDMDGARAAAQRALELEPGRAEAHAALGFISFLEGRLAGAVPEFEAAFAANPNYASAYAYFSWVRSAQGRIGDALQESEKAISLDPLSFINVDRYAAQLVLAGKLEAALAVNQRAANLRSDAFVGNLSQRAPILLALGRTEEAVLVARSVRHTALGAPYRRNSDADAIYTLRLCGLESEAAEYGAEVLARAGIHGYLRGFVLMAMGRFEDAAPYLEQAPMIMMPHLYWSAMWDPVRDDPRFGHVIARLGRTAEYALARAQ